MPSPARRRTVIQPWLIAIAVATVLAVAGGGYLLTRPGPAEKTSAQPAVVQPAVKAFEVAGAAAKCVRPVDPSQLREADAVFAATVTSSADGLATLEVTRTFHGEPRSEVRLRQRGGFSEALSGSGDFTIGRSYLLTISDGDVANCLSGPADDPSLQESYNDAFPATGE